MEYITIDLRGAEPICSSYLIGREGENGCTAFSIELPDKYLNCFVLLEFEFENGRKMSSELLDADESVKYEVKNNILLPGNVIIGVTLIEKNSKKVKKPFERTFVVSDSINALEGDYSEYGVAADHENRLRYLEETAGVTSAHINEKGELIIETGGGIVDARINEKGELEVEVI